MPKKLVKWGIRALSLADSSNGYLLNILLYTDAEWMGQITSSPHFLNLLVSHTFTRDTTFLLTATTVASPWPSP